MATASKKTASKKTSATSASVPTVTESLPPNVLKPVAASTQQPGYSKAAKYYTFNETGNIMIATTLEKSQQLPATVMNTFNEVSVFFAAMTKAITSTKKPDSTKGNPQYYSLYDYSAIKRVIDGSGCFVQVTEEELQYESDSFGVSFNLELVASILGVVASGGADLAFAQSLISTIAKSANKGEFTVSGDKSNQNGQAGNITFVCEYLLGMPIVSAIVAYTDEQQIKQAISVGPCFKESSVKTTLNINKDVYLFVTPSFIKNLSGDLDAIISDQQYGQFVNYLQSIINNAALITDITDENNNILAAGSTITRGTTYQINGIDFGDSSNQGIVCLGDYNSSNSNNQFTIISWSNSLIEISTGTNQSAATLNNITIYGATNQFLAKSNGKFSLTASSQ